MRAERRSSCGQVTLLTWRFLTARRQWRLSGTALASMRAVTRLYTPPETVAMLTAEAEGASPSARQDNTKTVAADDDGGPVLNAIPIPRGRAPLARKFSSH